MTPSPSLFQALLRPAVLQILRATGFHSTRPAVLDSLTDLAAAYLLLLCRATAAHAGSHVDNPVPLPPYAAATLAPDGTPYLISDGGLRVYRGGDNNGAPDPPTLTDVRLALEDVGAILPADEYQLNVERWLKRKNERRKAREISIEPDEARRKRRKNEEGEDRNNTKPAQETAPANVKQGDSVGEKEIGDAMEGVEGPVQMTSKTTIDTSAEEMDIDDEDDDDNEEEEDNNQLLDEDLRCLEPFVAWLASARMKQIRDLTAIDGEPEATDYLNALKMKHSKTSEDSKYHGTVLGKASDAGEVLVEGADVPSIRTWMDKMREAGSGSGARSGSGMLSPPMSNGGEDSRPPSSGLSSLGGRIDEDMDLL